MKLNPHLTFAGRCEEAFTCYARCLGGRLVAMLTYGASPLAAQTPREMHDKILHATLDLGMTRLTGADAPPAEARTPQGFAIMIEIAEPAEAERVFAALAEGGTITLALAETFWAARFGMLTDRFGQPWLVNCGRPAA